MYGNNKGRVGQQPPFLIVFTDKYSELDPFWNVRHLGAYLLETLVWLECSVDVFIIGQERSIISLLHLKQN